MLCNTATAQDSGTKSSTNRKNPWIYGFVCNSTFRFVIIRLNITQVPSEACFYMIFSFRTTKLFVIVFLFVTLKINPFLKWDHEWDASFRPKDCAPHSNAPRTSTREIILIRHGQYANVETAGDENHFLTETGRIQAKLTGERLAEVLKGREPTRILHSNMLRAKETAQIIKEFFPNAEIVEDPILAEGVPCLAEPPTAWKPKPGDLANDPQRLSMAFEKYIFRPPPSVKNPAATAMDVKIQPANKQQSNVELVVCHGNVIRYFFCRALQFPENAWLRFSVYNCGVTRLNLDDQGAISCRELGSVGHLPATIITYH